MAAVQAPVEGFEFFLEHRQNFPGVPYWVVVAMIPTPEGRVRKLCPHHHQRQGTAQMCLDATKWVG